MAKKASRGAYGSGSLRRRSNGNGWEGRYSYLDATGKPCRGSVYGTTQKETRQKLTAVLEKIDSGNFLKPSQITLESWLWEWLTTFVEPTVKPLTLDAYRTSIRAHLVPALGAVKLQQIRGLHVQQLYNKMLKDGSSPKTVKNCAAILHKSLDMAVKQGLIQSNPCDAATLPKAQNKEIKPLADAEIPLFLEAIKGDEYQNVFALCLFAGLREGECLGLSWSQVDFQHGRITVSQQLQKRKERGAHPYIAPFTKSSKNRVIEPPAIAFEFLRQERQRQAENRLLVGAGWSNPNNLVFTNPFGAPLSAGTVLKHCKRVGEHIGRPDLRVHDLRHTAATVAITSGASVKATQQLLGHSTASFTLNVYTHPSEKMMKDAAARVQSYYDNLGYSQK